MCLQVRPLVVLGSAGDTRRERKWLVAKSQGPPILVQNTEKSNSRDCSGGSVFRNPPANAGDMSSIPGPRRFHMPQGD